MNDNLTILQIDEINSWGGEEVLSLYPRGLVGKRSLQREQEMEYQSTEFWCAMKKLDDLGIPRIDKSLNKTYSIVGRIQWMMDNL